MIHSVCSSSRCVADRWLSWPEEVTQEKSKLATERASLDLATDLSTMRNALMGDIKEVEDALDEKVRLLSDRPRFPR